MSEEYDMSIHHNPDAKAWAEFYKATFPDADEELMHSWFANAMMAMYDHVQNTEVAPLKQQIEQAQGRIDDLQYDKSRLRLALMDFTDLPSAWVNFPSQCKYSEHVLSITPSVGGPSK